MDTSLDGAPAAQTVNIPLLSTKGKRTKRLRPDSPLITTTAADYLRLSPPSPESSTTDEIETAKSLLLLSQGIIPKTHNNNNNNNNSVVNSDTNNTGLVYTCKTCSRTFSSFQALGGHRTSHRKTKTDRKSASVLSDNDDDFPSTSKFASPNYSLSLQLKPSPSPRMHECAYCGAEFTSGQALGGHMRKHRGGGPIGRPPSYIPIEEMLEADDSAKRQKMEFPPLDLNLPAPEDERGPKEKGVGETPAVRLSGALAPLLIDKV